MKDHLTNTDILPLIAEYNGNLSAVARRLGCTRRTLHNRMQRSAEVRAAFDDAREGMLDNAESKLYQNILGGDTTALIFFLKTQGKRRGYSEKLDIDLSQGKRPEDMTDDELEHYIAIISARFGRA